MGATKLNRPNFWAASLVLACVACPAGDALAQQNQPSRTTTDPGQLERRLETPSVPMPPSAPVVTAPVAPPALLDEQAEAFTLVAVELDGATVFTAEQLAAEYEPFLGQQITVVQVEQILARITARYREAGYVLSYAVAPPQPVAFGVLQIRIVEGYVGKVTYAGAQPGGSALLKAYADKITAQRPATLAVLERYALLASDAPGVTVRPSLRALPDPGAYEYILTLEHDMLQGFAGIDNRGTHSVGPLQAYAGVSLNSIFSMLDRTRLTASTVPDNNRELRYGEIFHEQFLDSEGTRGFMSISRSTIDTYSDVFMVPKQGDSTRLSLGATHPFIRDRAENWWLNARVDALNSSQSQVGSNFDDRLRVMRLGTQYFFSDGWAGNNVAVVEFSRGADFLGASDDRGEGLSRAGGRTNFSKFTVELSREQALGRNFAAVVQGVAQQTDDVLLSAEEIALGGKRFGRAFDPGEVSGQEGVAGSLELRYFDSTGWDVMSSYQIYLFGDVGAVWSRGRDREALSSAGGGVRLGLIPGVIGSAEVAVPINRPVFAEQDLKDQRNPRVFFAVNASF